jgi:hypothetical protein
MLTNNNTENHMVLSDPPDDDSSEIHGEVEVKCCRCDNFAELPCIYNDEWTQQQLDENIRDYFWPGKIYCYECMFQVENVLPKQDLLDAHFLWELKEMYQTIELYDEFEYRIAQDMEEYDE